MSRGRHPHQKLFRPWQAHDERVVTAAMHRTGVADLADRPVDELSDAQRQQVWLAQETPILLLDEPTTFLDIAHQHEMLDLCADLHEAGQTIVAVLHDLNQAFRYATHVVVMRPGGVAVAGQAAEIVSTELIEDVFGLRCRIIDDPETGTPLVVPARRASVHT